MPPLAAVVGFIDCINSGDIDSLAALMHDEHRLVVLDEEPLRGKAANVEAWKGYFSSFPEYVIYPRHVVASGHKVAVLGTTTGSHLGLPDEEEMNLPVIWIAEVTDGLLTLWQVADDSPELRATTGLQDK